jgi:hypothetical protein
MHDWCAMNVLILFLSLFLDESIFTRIL